MVTNQKMSLKEGEYFDLRHPKLPEGFGHFVNKKQRKRALLTKCATIEAGIWEKLCI